MKILMIRHGEPNYEKDCLTERGRQEAALLAERIEKLDIDSFYVSPMGRARETAQFTLERLGRQAQVCDWLHEFNEAVMDGDEPRVTWDMLPKYWTKHDEYYSKLTCCDTKEMAAAEMRAKTQAVYDGLDSLLASQGLVREGRAYRVTGDHHKTIAMYCHFGITCLMISHLIGISPLLAWQGFSADPTAIATLCTDDRFGDYVSFRVHGFGDTHHLQGFSQSRGKVNYQ